MSPGGVAAPRSSVRCASLSTCCPARSDSLGPADAAVPLHPIHPAARSTFGGRSSQSPQSVPRLPPPCQGWAQDHCDSAFPRKRRGKSSTRSPGGRSAPHRSTLGTPSVYYDTITMSSRVARGALCIPARLTAMGPCEQEEYCTRFAQLCQVKECRWLLRRDDAWITIQQREVALSQYLDALEHQVGRRIRGQWRFSILSLPYQHRRHARS